MKLWQCAAALVAALVLTLCAIAWIGVPARPARAVTAACDRPALQPFDAEACALLDQFLPRPTVH